MENFYCAIIVIKFVDQDIIEFFSCFLHKRQSVEFFNDIYNIYIYNIYKQNANNIQAQFTIHARNISRFSNIIYIIFLYIAIFFLPVNLVLSIAVFCYDF